MRNNPKLIDLLQLMFDFWAINDLYVIFDGNMDKLSPGENCPFLCNYALIGFCASQIVPKVEI